MADVVNHFIDQGASFTYSRNLLDANGALLNTTGFVVNSAMRKAYTATNSVVFTANVANGVLTLSLTAAQTANVASGRYVYDAYLNDTGSNTVSRAIEGVVTIKPAATR